MSWHIRAARPTDRRALAELYRRSSLSNAGDRPRLLEEPDALELPWSQERPETTRVATRDGRIVGFAAIAIDGDLAELEDLFVDPDSMRQRVATALIDDVSRLARDRGARRLKVTANPHALAFYLQVGFLDDGPASTRFGPARQMHLDLGA